MLARPLAPLPSYNSPSSTEMRNAIKIVGLLVALAFVSSGLAQQPSTVTNLPFASIPFDGSELLYVIQHGNSRKTSAASLAQQAGIGGNALFTSLAGSQVSANASVVTSAGYSAPGVGVATYVVDANVNSAFVAAHPGWSFLSADGRGWRMTFQPAVTVTWEQFGALGTTKLDGSVITDDSAAMNAAADYGRYFGQLIISGNGNAVYTINGNPYFLVDIPNVLDIDWHGATLVNLYGHYHSTNPFSANFNTLITTGMMLPNGPTTYAGCVVNGLPITTAAQGATTITAADGATVIPPGEYLITAQNRQDNVIGFPPSASYLEYAAVTTGGVTATLQEPLQNPYEQYSPQLTNGPYATFGPAWAYPLSSTNNGILTPESGCSYTPYVITQYMSMKNLNCAAPPGYIGPANQAGKITLGGAWVGKYSGINCPLVYVTTGKDIEYDDAQVSLGGVTSASTTLEIDKLIDHMRLKNIRVGTELSSAYGVNDLDIDDSYIASGMNLEPVRSLNFHGGTIASTVSPTSHTLIGPSDPGVPITIIDRTRLLPNSVVDHMLDTGAYPITVGSVATVSSVTTISMTRTAWNAAWPFVGQARIGSYLYDANNMPAFLITRGFYCPDTNVLTGNVAFDGVALEPITPSEVLKIWNVGTRFEWNTARVDGPYANDLTTTFGTLGAAVFPTLDLVAPERPASGTELKYSQANTYPFRVAGYGIPIGGKFFPDQIIIDVHVAASGASTLELRNKSTESGGFSVMVQAIDLTTVGTRILDRQGNSLLGSDTLGSGGGIVSPGTYLQYILINDGSAAFQATAGQAQYTITLKGRFAR